MKRSIIFSFLKDFSKVYLSNARNKEQKYKKIIFNKFKDLGGIYIKFLQTLCVTKKFMEGWAGPKEFEIFNKVNKEEINLSNIINLNDYSYIEKEPFACGSFAQVYRANLNSGKKVAIKVLRPSVQRYLKSDLKLLSRIVKIISLFLKENILDYTSAFDEFKTNCLLETDYKREIANMHYFAKIYNEHPHVVIPKVYDKYCKRNVIVQEFIEGPTIADITSTVPRNKSLSDYAYEKTGSDIWMQMMIAGGECLRTAMTEDYVFGDPHPGNIILLPNDKIAYIDFGIIVHKPKSREAFYRFVKSYYDILMGKEDYAKLIETSMFCFCPDIANALKLCSMNMKTDYFRSISTAINRKIKLLKLNNVNLNSTLNDGHMFIAFTKIIDNNNSLNIQIDYSNFGLLKAMQALICSINTIDSKYGENRFSKIMIGSMRYALKYCKKNGIKRDMNYNTKYDIGESYELLLENLSSLASKDEFLFKNLSEMMFQ